MRSLFLVGENILRGLRCLCGELPLIAAFRRILKRLLASVSAAGLLGKKAKPVNPE